MQTLLSLASLVMVMAFAMNLYRSTATTEQRLMVGEIATHLVSAADDVMAYLSTRPFDANATPTDSNPLPVRSPADLTPPADFGTSGCTLSYDETRRAYQDTCQALEDYDGQTFDLPWAGMTFRVEIDVDYVDPAAPTTPVASPTYAKLVTVRVTRPGLYFGTPDNEAVVPLSRVFVYPYATPSDD
ncbi:MAG: hypothetical protein D6685_06285 [Bacteroidetes bacterium]|nr:hypothetical protein AWN76_015795 [Rhodothermaceae bacterium RA]RMH64971.1 MAG: hypothetical protein D6685_06285 [Bacteroidota bacterium]